MNKDTLTGSHFYPTRVTGMTSRKELAHRAPSSRSNPIDSIHTIAIVQRWDYGATAQGLVEERVQPHFWRLIPTHHRLSMFLRPLAAFKLAAPSLRRALCAEVEGGARGLVGAVSLICLCGAPQFRPHKPGHIEDGLSSFMFTIDHKSGSLTNVLDLFRKHGLNMTSIESRPNKGA